MKARARIEEALTSCLNVLFLYIFVKSRLFFLQRRVAALKFCFGSL